MTFFSDALARDADLIAALGAKVSINALGSTGFTATGGNTSRTLASYLSDLNNVKNLGAKGNTVSSSTTVTITLSGTSLTVGASIFVLSDVGKVISALVSGAALFASGTTITGYTSATQVTVSSGALSAQTGSAAVVTWGTNDLTALTSTLMPAFLPEGVFNIGGSFATLIGGSSSNRRWHSGTGDGIIKTSEGLQSGNIAYIKAPPASLTAGSFLWNDFNGETQNHLGFQTWITGATTLGQPSSGYQFNTWANGIVGVMYNASGYNASPDHADGRTNVGVATFKVYQGGNGDMMCLNLFGSTASTAIRPGATYYLGSPVAQLISGSLGAGVDKCNLNSDEVHLIDNGYSCTMWGHVRSMVRNTTTPVQEWPCANSFLASSGTTPIDAQMVVTGLARIGIDFTSTKTRFREMDAVTVNNAAIAFYVGHRLYGNATNAQPHNDSNPAYTLLGTEWLSYETATGWNMVVGSTPVLQASATAITASKNFIRKAATADQSADVFVATTGGSRTIPNGCSWECLTPAATIATFTTTMPAAPIDKQEVWLSTTQTITTWTLNANTGQTINGAPTTLVANTSVMFRYNLPTTAWFRMS